MNFKFTELTKNITRPISDEKGSIKRDHESDYSSYDKKLILKNLQKKERIFSLLETIALLTSGVITGFSMPGYNLSILAWFGFIPLISVLTLERSFNKALFNSYIFGLGFFSVSLFWLYSLHPLNWLGFSTNQSILTALTVWLAVSAIVSLYLLLFGVIARSFTTLDAGPVFKSIIIASCWVIIMNKLASVGPFAFPWALIEYSQYKNINLLQIAQYIGGIGISFLILFFNCVLAFTIIDFFKKSKSRRALITGTITISLFILAVHYVGGHILNSDKLYKIPLTATIIQNNSTLENKNNELAQLSNTKKSILSKINNSPSGIIVLPEAAVYDFIRQKDKAFYWELDKVSRIEDKTLVLGMLDITHNKFGKPAPTNSALVIDRKLELNPKNVYNKQFLVPFGEYIPFRDKLPELLNYLANKLTDIDFIPGKETKVMETSIGKVAPTICYEIVFPDLIKKQVQKKANILVNISSLCWYHDSIIKDQFVAFGVMRAAEFRRPFIIAVNTGNSVFINYNGKIIKELPRNKALTETAKLNYNYEETFYSKLFI